MSAVLTTGWAGGIQINRTFSGPGALTAIDQPWKAIWPESLGRWTAWEDTIGDEELHRELHDPETGH